MPPNYPPGYPPPPGYPQQPYAPPPYGAPQAPPPGYAPPPYDARRGPESPPPYAPPPGGYPHAPPPYGAPQAPPAGAPGYGRQNVMSGLGDVDPTGSRLPHFNAGHRYILQNEKLEFFQGRKDPYVTSEWTILESDDHLLQPGRSAKYMIKWGQDMSLPNFKRMLGALYGLSDSDAIKAAIGDKEGALAISDAQPARGKIVELRTEATKTKANTDFTVHNWSPVDRPMGAPAPQFGGANPAAVTPSGQYAPHGPPAGPAMPAPAHVAPPFPPPGWFPHPAAPGSFHNGKVTHTEAELRAMQAQGRA